MRTLETAPGIRPYVLFTSPASPRCFTSQESSLGIAGGGFRNSVGPEVPWVVGTAETELKGPGKNSNKIQVHLFSTKRRPLKKLQYQGCPPPEA